ncbi:hypothetical protein AB9K34_00100 [Sedimentitalea sp. XS_ASV28]|uniref:hypothetical protein n=1 Tax=Sedimentitalea sp. XS_ASV28 TaxID=3241296 RepID=UPI0035160D9A
MNCSASAERVPPSLDYAIIKKVRESLRCITSRSSIDDPIGFSRSVIIFGRTGQGLTKLQEKTGSNAPLKKFRLNIRQIIEDDHTPFYRMELTAEDLVIFRPRSPQNELLPEIRLPGWAEEKARTIAREKGRDYYALRSDWLAFAKSEAAKGNPPKNAGAAFVAYCGKQDSLR